MPHEFVILNNGSLQTYNNFEEIPSRFDNLIKFLPDIPPAPHNHKQHKEIEEWNNKLKELLKREK